MQVVYKLIWGDFELFMNSWCLEPLILFKCLFKLCSYGDSYGHEAWWLWCVTGLYYGWAGCWPVVGIVPFCLSWSLPSFFVLTSLNATSSWFCVLKHSCNVAVNRCGSRPDQMLSNFSYFWADVGCLQLWW